MIVEAMRLHVLGGSEQVWRISLCTPTMEQFEYILGGIYLSKRFIPDFVFEFIQAHFILHPVIIILLYKAPL